ncbi:MAG: lysylphosphatidylglycerol synthase transmembrane domain-containing protein [Methanomassiliicoccus sp.]|nr:lysylphosphatidylglycerol synthase transmembrane domain-containing protein [Methanomassiliicoccus sp.]
MRRNLGAIFKLVFSLLLIALTVVAADPSELVDALTGVDVSLIAVVVLLYTLNLFVKTYRWDVLIGAAGETAPYRSLFRNYAIAQAINNVTPGRVAGEASKIYGARSNNGIEMGKGLATVVAERVMDLTLLIILVTVGLVAFAHYLVGNMFSQLALAVVVAVGLNVAVIALMARPELIMGMARRTASFLERLLGARWGSKASSAILRVSESFNEALRSGSLQDKKLLVKAAVLTVAIWSNEMLRTYLMIVAVHASIDLSAILIVTGLSALSAVLLIAGSGNVVVSSVILVAAGMTSGQATCVGLLSAMTSIWISVPIGLAALAIGGSRAKDEHGVGKNTAAPEKDR